MDLAALRTQQQQLAASVERADRLDRDPPALIGGADVGFEQEGEVTRAAMVLLTWPELELVEYQVARVATSSSIRGAGAYSIDGSILPWSATL